MVGLLVNIELSECAVGFEVNLPEFSNIVLDELCNKIVGFEVLTPVVMKSCTFWDITPCSPLKVDLHFGGTCHLHLQGRKINRA
jgi:hypothetical protein